MTTLSHDRSSRVDVLHPAMAALAGAATFAVSMAAGAVFDLNADGPDAPATTVTDVLWYVGLVLVAVVLATWLGMRARAGSPTRLARYAVGLALAAAVTFVVFWSGWPHVLAAVAIALALEHRRRVGAFSGTAVAAAGLGAVALAASILLCLFG